jgi:hypothetical protein
MGIAAKDDDIANHDGVSGMGKMIDAGEGGGGEGEDRKVG